MKRKTFYIKGMHCASCNILVEDKFCEVKNVRGVKADFRNQTAIVSYKGHLDKEVLNDTIKLHGYKIANPSSIQEDQEPFLSRLIQSSAFFVIFLILFFFAQELKLLPSFSASAGLSLTVVFILGLVASTSTCMATSGALFLSTIGKFNSGQTSVGENLIPAISFNVGRILSYGFFGLLVGFLGKSAAQSFQLGPLLMGFVAISMVFIGLDMMKLIAGIRFSPTDVCPELNLPIVDKNSAPEVAIQVKVEATKPRINTTVRLNPAEALKLGSSLSS